MSNQFEQQATQQVMQFTLWKMYGALLAFFVLLATWLVFDLHRGYTQVLTDTAFRATQRSEIIGQNFRTEVLAADYVLRDVLGRFQEQDLVYPDPDPSHARRMTMLLKEKADTVPDFFSMVLFDRNCVFAVTATGQNTGAKSKSTLCEARKNHHGAGPLATYVPGKDSASGKSVLVLSRNLTTPGGEFLGGVIGVIELESAQHRFDAMDLEIGDSVALLDVSQVLLARHPLLAQSIEKSVVSPKIPKAMPANASDVKVAMQPDVDGQERLFGFSKIESFPFVVAYGVDRAKVLRDWRRRALELGVGYITLLILAVLAARAHWTIRLQRDELMASRAALQELAMHDPLTGLYNRRFLDAVMTRELARSQREGKPLAVIMLDLDYFKKVNDEFSHAAGDEVLKALARLLTQDARESDLICRYGGEEFVAVMPDMATTQALERVESWRKQLEATRVVHNDFKISVTMSAGIAVFPEHGKNPDLLLTRADEMLYQSKREGRNRVSVAQSPSPSSPA